ncbi:MAG: alpha/beta hydrolase [Rhodospirillales bacterium]|nr:alpha/beta hydrolase [Rhodospirillales bacterium]
MLKSLTYLLAAAVFLLAAGSQNGASAQDGVGIVLMHGKGGTAKPTSPVGRLADALDSAGFMVLAPDMPWSRSRIWDRSFDRAMAEIDTYVTELRRKGAKKIVVGGHSLGANAALRYGARRDGLAGILAIAPGHTPEVRGFQSRMEHDYRRAAEMVANGKGDKADDFRDFNQGRASDVRATAKIYLSWYDPEGPAVMPKNAAGLKPGTPLMWIIGRKDVMLKFGRGRNYAFDLAPSHPRSAYLEVPGGHRATPRKGKDEIIKWLKGL